MCNNPGHVISEKRIGFRILYCLTKSNFEDRLAFIADSLKNGNFISKNPIFKRLMLCFRESFQHANVFGLFKNRLNFFERDIYIDLTFEVKI